jgi:hypothetical protein
MEAWLRHWLDTISNYNYVSLAAILEYTYNILQHMN